MSSGANTDLRGFLRGQRFAMVVADDDNRSAWDTCSFNSTVAAE